MRVILTGSSGLVGTALARELKSKGHTVHKLVRHQDNLAPDESYWDPDEQILRTEELERFDAIINLAGENISSGRWTAEKKKRILDSRVQSTRAIAETLSQMSNPTPIWINASAIGYYGDRADESLTEASAAGSGFLADVCKQWEAATGKAKAKGVRIALLRTGMVLSEKGGALAKMVTPFKLGLGGRIGSGEQYMSWVALEDLTKIIEFILSTDTLQGPVNAVSPTPIKNRDFVKTLASSLNMPALIPMPAFAARLAFGEMADELLLSSERVFPAKLHQEEFVYQHPDLGEYLSKCFD
jgi:uncharacterized protein (TIGR01777 family)